MPPRELTCGPERGDLHTSLPGRRSPFYRLNLLCQRASMTIVIGGGPGGYVAAIRAAQLGPEDRRRRARQSRAAAASTTPASRRRRSCASAELYDEAKNGAELGIVADDITIDWDALQARRGQGLANRSPAASKFLWDKNKIDHDRGRGLADRRRQRRRSATRPTRPKRGGPRHRLGRAADPRASSSAAASSTPGAPGRCPSSRRRSPWSAPAPRARRSPPPTPASAPR